MLGVVLVGEDAAVDVGMQRLHPAAEDFGEAGHVADRGDGRPAFSRNFSVPPVETSSTPLACKKVANSASPSLWVTLEQSPPDGKEIHSIRS